MTAWMRVVLPCELVLQFSRLKEKIILIAASTTNLYYTAA